jgi:cell division protein FtsW
MINKTNHQGYYLPNPAGSIDWLLLLTTMLLTLIGVVMIYSASSNLAAVKFNDSAFFLKRQLVRMVLACIVLVLAVRCNYESLRKFSLPLLVITFVLLLFLFIPGISLSSGAIKGAKRWLGLGPLTFQPSDLAKFALVIYAADYLTRKQDKLENFKEGLLPLLAVVGVFLGIILAEPNFSTTMAITGIVGIVIFVGRAKLKHFFYLGLSVIPLILVFMLSASYRYKRVMAFLDPSDAQGASYQTIQSFVGLGNGGLFGLGLGQGRQKLFFLPEPYSDYIFSVIGEEIGFIGVMVIMTLFIVLIWRGLRIARRAPDLFGFLLAVGMVSIIAIYMFLNLGVVVGVLPSTGLPLPFISYGGTSLVFNFLAIGILLNISKFQKKA